ncbi:MOXD1 homolog 1 [Trichogramma pretiosum]|uniref:MOXD1 homolog 1 n=1 Tax=Trichogramma pretiosum TaxID=7493 RepID=UPI0006C9D71C|nr:MOXD1 homolog 1 [Trichogramma pretiosum]
MHQRGLIFALLLCGLVGSIHADLMMDLYVKLMDDSMFPTDAKPAPRSRRFWNLDESPSFHFEGPLDGPLRMRSKRSAVESPFFRVANPVKQHLDGVNRRIVDIYKKPDWMVEMDRQFYNEKPQPVQVIAQLLGERAESEMESRILLDTEKERNKEDDATKNLSLGERRKRFRMARKKYDVYQESEKKHFRKSRPRRDVEYSIKREKKIAALEARHGQKETVEDAHGSSSDGHNETYARELKKGLRAMPNMRPKRQAETNSSSSSSSSDGGAEHEQKHHHHHNNHQQHRRVFTRRERLDDNGDVILEWDPIEPENVTFRLTARTLGYVGLGFNDKSNMLGADIVIAWVDDQTHQAMILDSHGSLDDNRAPETDASQDVYLLHGWQNDTHTSVTFTRPWHLCDPDNKILTADTIRVLWALHPTDPELNQPAFHGDRRGSRALRLKASAPHGPPTESIPDLIKWDVKLNQFTVSNHSDTVYWCKIFKAPKLHRKHHMIGFTPLVQKSNEKYVHHVLLYECSSQNSILAEHARIAGAHCYSPTMPKEWDTCLQPVLTWIRGSQGEWLPRHVGLPIAEHLENSYYMLEVHYSNRDGRRVVDSSGVRLYLTPDLRPMEAGILVAGVAVSPMHMVPPQQREYATAGYCTPQCTEKMFDEAGINVVSVVLHSHHAGKRMSLRHVRRGRELEPIVQDRSFDFEYQQTYTLAREAKILPGDELVAECVYDTRGRARPTFGGYAATQEMCLAFVMHYPRTPLAACYSMTPVKEFFNALNVQSFRGVTMEQVERLFVATTADTVALPKSPNHHSPSAFPGELENDAAAGREADSGDDDLLVKQTKSAILSKGDYVDYDDIFSRLVIEKPDEFKDHTLSDHMQALAWNDTSLSKSIERSLYHGRHVTFCRTRNDKYPLAASIQMFPNFTVLPPVNETICAERLSARGLATNSLATSYATIFAAFFVLCLDSLRHF